MTKEEIVEMLKDNLQLELEVFDNWDGKQLKVQIRFGYEWDEDSVILCEEKVQLSGCGV